MAFDEFLADRIRSSLSRRAVRFVEKRMMGGLCFMVSEKMCLGISDSRLMARLDPAIQDEALKKPGCVPMDFTGRPMKGFVFIQPEGHEENSRLEYWIDLALQFNPRAKASKRRKASSPPSTSPPKPRRPPRKKRKTK